MKVSLPEDIRLALHLRKIVTGESLTTILAAAFGVAPPAEAGE